MENKPMRRIEVNLDPSDLWDYVSQAPKSEADYQESLSAPSRWNGNVTYESALDMARNGWPEGLAKVTPLLARVDELVAHAMPERVLAYDVVGDVPDVGAYLSGVPENMQTTEEAPGASKMIRVLVNVGGSSSVDAETIQARGVIACALVDSLEKAGYRVEVVAGWECATYGDDHLRFGVRTTLKRAEEALVLDRLTYVLIHPSFMRKLLFRCTELIENERDRNKFLHHGYGRPAPFIGDPGDVVITEMYGNDWTTARMADEVARYLREVGVVLDGAPS